MDREEFIKLKIALCASMVFTERMLEIKLELEKIGHEVFVSQFAEEYVGKSERGKNFFNEPNP